MSETCFSRLSEGGQLLVWSMRHWMVALVRNQRVPDNVIRSLDSLGDASMFGAITALVLLASRDADRPLCVFPPCSDALSLEEEHMARALECFSRDAPLAAKVHLDRLVGTKPSGALFERVRHVARRFRSAGVYTGDLMTSPHLPAY
jgi:hypothetical protein